MSMRARTRLARRLSRTLRATGQRWCASSRGGGRCPQTHRWQHPRAHCCCRRARVRACVCTRVPPLPHACMPRAARSNGPVPQLRLARRRTPPGCLPRTALRPRRSSVQPCRSARAWASSAPSLTRFCGCAAAAGVCGPGLVWHVHGADMRAHTCAHMRAHCRVLPPPPPRAGVHRCCQACTTRHSSTRWPATACWRRRRQQHQRQRRPHGCSGGGGGGGGSC
jgi:hypothetical protein